MFNVSKSDLAFTFALSRSGAMWIEHSVHVVLFSNAEKLNCKYHLETSLRSLSPPGPLNAEVLWRFLRP